MTPDEPQNIITENDQRHTGSLSAARYRRVALACRVSCHPLPRQLQENISFYTGCGPRPCRWLAPANVILVHPMPSKHRCDHYPHCRRWNRKRAAIASAVASHSSPIDALPDRRRSAAANIASSPFTFRDFSCGGENPLACHWRLHGLGVRPQFGSAGRLGGTRHVINELQADVSAADGARFDVPSVT